MLTPRQIEALQLVADGRKAKQIADAMGIGQKAVENALVRTRETLGALNSAHAVALALRAGLIR